MGRVTDHELNAVEVEEIWVQTETRWVNVSTDGEVGVMTAPLHYRTRPRALGVVVPARNGQRLLADNSAADRLHQRLEGDRPVVVDFGNNGCLSGSQFSGNLFSELGVGTFIG